MRFYNGLHERSPAFWGHSIRSQLAITFGLLTFAVMASFSYLMYVQQRDLLYVTDTDRAQGLARTLASSSASLLLNENTEELQQVLHGFGDTPDLKFASVISPQGKVLGATNPERIGRYMHDLPSKKLLGNTPLGNTPQLTTLINDNRNIDIAVPIEVSGRHLGWARVEMSRQSSHANLNLLGIMGVSFSLLSVLAAFAMAAWLSWRLSGRLYHLIHIMKMVEHGDRQVRSGISAQDEVGKLAQSFDGMLDTLNASERELGRMNRLYAAWTESSEVIVRQKNESQLLNSICKILAERVPFELVWIGVPGNDGWVRPIAFSGSSSDYLKSVRVSLDVTQQEGQGPSSMAITAGVYQVFNHFLEDANAYWHAAAVKFNFNSAGAFPISRNGRIFGCIAVYSSAVNFFSSAHIGLMSGLADDITFALDNLDREHQQRVAAIKLEQAATVFEFSKEGIIVTDADNRIISVNRSFSDITGYNPEEAIGKNPRLLSSGLQPADFYDRMWFEITQTGSWQGEIWNRRKNGEIYPSALTIIQVKNSDAVIINHLAIFSDISERKIAQERIEQLAHYDVLTGLPNRVLFSDRLHQAMMSAQRNNSNIALLFLDIDRFKQINDTLGHGAGDLMLQSVGQRLLRCVREEDTVSRQGGDEFIVVLNNTSSLGAELVAKKILHSILQPYQIEAHDLRITASIGIAVYPEHAQDRETLIKHADVAMYQAKESGRNCYMSFHPDMNQSAYERLRLENALRGALERSELRVYYQAQVNLEDGSIIGCEALVRWQHPELGMVYPDKFIPIAEESGLIVSINHWVLEEAIKQCSIWRDAGYTSLTMSVNLSAHQFRQHDLLQQVGTLLKKYAVPPGVLNLELTESALMEGVERTLVTLHELSAMGIILSLDDFGTGYSSLSYLKRFPMRQLKIDQSFVRDIFTNPNDATMVRTIVLMAKTLKLDVIAEGVETEEQADFLLQNGCRRAQGYHFKHPLTAEVFERILQKNPQCFHQRNLSLQSTT